jgi:hypothetical protein
VRLEIEAQDVPGHGDVEDGDDRLAVAARQQPHPVTFEQLHVLGRPAGRRLRPGCVGRQAAVAPVVEGLIGAPGGLVPDDGLAAAGHGWPPGTLGAAQLASFWQAA